MRSDGKQRGRCVTARLVIPALAAGLASVTGAAPVFGGAVAATSAAPAISAEYPVADPVVAPPRFDQAGSALASNGNGYLAAWADSRPKPNGATGTVRASVLRADGVPVNPYGFDVSNGEYRDLQPSVAWNNGVYLVVWGQIFNEGPPDMYGRSYRPDVYGARVAADGTVLDPGGFAIAAVPESSQGGPVVTALGDGFLVVWQDDRPGKEGIRATRVAASGAVLDSDGIDVAVGGPDKTEPDVASTGDKALVAWTESSSNGSDIRGSRVGTDGTVLETSSFPIATGFADEVAPAVASNGVGFLVGWEDQGTDVYARRVRGSGEVLDPGGLRVSAAGSHRPRPAVASDGSGYIIAWGEWDLGGHPNNLRARRLSANGTFSDASPLVVRSSPDGYPNYISPAATWGPGGYLLSWDQHVNVADVYATLVPESGPPHDSEPVLIAGEPNEQLQPAVGWDGSNYLVAWSDSRAGRHIYAARVSPSGVAQDGTGIPVSSAVGRSPKVAWNGTNYLVAWIGGPGERDRIYAARLSPEGRVLDAGGIAVSLPNYAPEADFSLVSNGSEFIIAWQGFEFQVFAFGMYATRLTSDGQVSQIELPSDGIHPSVGWNGKRYLVAWYDGSTGTIQAVRITRGRADRRPITVSPGSAAAYKVRVASDGENFMVGWSDYRSGDGDVYGARVSDKGRVLDAQGVLALGTPRFDSVEGLVWNGHHYVIASSPQDSRPYVARLSGDGVALDPAAVPVDSTSAAESVKLTDLAAGPPGEAALLIERPIPDPPYNGAARSFVRMFDGGAGAGGDGAPCPGEGRPAGRPTSGRVVGPQGGSGPRC